jgi:5-methylcytosine-specific restriction endonuclease McrA
MSDRRYSTARWQRLRKAVLARYGYVCQIQGPRCRGVANTVHHILPSSQYPELFWNPENLEAACSPCNYGDGSRIAAENTRRTIERLYAIIEEQEQQIAQMVERVGRYEDAKGDQAAPARPSPAIY